MTASIQRPLKGSRLSSFYPIKNLPSLASLDSAFQLQEYISLLIRLDVHDVEKIVAIPGKQSTHDPISPQDPKIDEKDGKNDVAVDEACWIYEQLRRLAQDLSHPLITMLQQECTRKSCPEMKAGEWQYLCVAHGNDGALEQCCAIDYIIHTLDSATALLNSPTAFPSRLSIPASSSRHFASLARRLGRIFAHAYFHHRETFEQAEAESSLYARFLTLTSKFDLVPSEFLVIPPRVGNMEDSANEEVEPPRLMAAAVDPRREREKEREKQLSKEHKPEESVLPIERDYVYEEERRPSPLLNPSDASRKFGRPRTDTMVLSEAVIVAEDLSKLEGNERVDVEESNNLSEDEIVLIESLAEVSESLVASHVEKDTILDQQVVDVTTSEEVKLESETSESSDPVPSDVSTDDLISLPQPSEKIEEGGPPSDPTASVLLHEELSDTTAEDVETVVETPADDEIGNFERLEESRRWDKVDELPLETF